MRFVVLLATLSVLAIVACQSAGVLTPPTGPGTEYPCGINGHECPDSMCCDNNSTCCDGTSCTKGYCEYVGDALFGARRDAGVPQLVPATRAR